LVIEIDGSSHDSKVEYDNEREAYLKQLGLKIFRIKVIDVFKRLTYVMQELEVFFIENYTDNFDGNTLILPPRSSTTPPSEGNFAPEQFSQEQFFKTIPNNIYNYKIGNFHPIIYWFELNKNKSFTHDDFLHFQKIIIAIEETKKTYNN
jgi:hypothetical protein